MLSPRSKRRDLVPRRAEYAGVPYFVADPLAGTLARFDATPHLAVPHGLVLDDAIVRDALADNARPARLHSLPPAPPSQRRLDSPLSALDIHPPGWLLQYAGGELDRAGVMRKRDDWVASALGNPRARLVPVWQGRNLMLRDGAAPPVPQLPTLAEAGALLEDARQHVLLGILDDVPYIAVAPAGDSEHDAVAAAGGGEFLDLRKVGPLLTGPDASLLAYARGMLHWNDTHQFCSRCGSAANSISGGHVRKCASDACARESYPRTDPAVIMLVTLPASDTTPARCLLGRDPRFPPGVFSTLAGFVEPGESLEEAVAREVLEEVGVQVRDVRYRASQPWPFPASIMLGFDALATSEVINIDPDEIAEAHWFTRDQVEGFGEWGDEGEGNKLPRRDSIARALIQSWLARDN